MIFFNQPCTVIAQPLRELPTIAILFFAQLPQVCSVSLLFFAQLPQVCSISRSPIIHSLQVRYGRSRGVAKSAESGEPVLTWKDVLLYSTDYSFETADFFTGKKGLRPLL
jgi:hypothetical protein